MGNEHIRDDEASYRVNTNMVAIGGNLSKDATFKMSNPMGVPMSTFTLGNNGVVKGVSKPTWVRIVGFNAIAKAFSRYGKKGRKVTITGRLETREYIDHNTKITLAIDTMVTLLDGSTVILPEGMTITGSAEKIATEVIAFSYDFGDAKPKEPIDRG